MEILVCPLSRVVEQVARYSPERLVSLLDPEEVFPDFGPQFDGRHLRLAFHDAHVAGPKNVLPSPDQVYSFLQFVAAWERKRPLLIHCRAGIGRSTAAAYIAACFANPSTDEYEVAVRLREVAPLARPNEILIKIADVAMDRGGRLTAAIAATGRDLPWLDLNEGEPFRLDLRANSAERRG